MQLWLVYWIAQSLADFFDYKFLLFSMESTFHHQGNCHLALLPSQTWWGKDSLVTFIWVQWKDLTSIINKFLSHIPHYFQLTYYYFNLLNITFTRLKSIPIVPVILVFHYSIFMPASFLPLGLSAWNSCYLAGFLSCQLLIPRSIYFFFIKPFLTGTTRGESAAVRMWKYQ